ncbi:MAG: aminoglycoside phosphotransferase (APT) family kinase protein [Gammaproteobacteria bacterium]|jgi:aminoglycoside phosphotransferase (APT) family kinase protein
MLENSSMCADATKHAAPEGYDVKAVEAWIKENIKSLAPPFLWKRLEGGHSNLTYLITDQNGVKAVIRRPPQGQLLPKAHDMGREWAIISALGPTSVPVAAALGFCESPDVTGAHFYVMGHVSGAALHTAQDTARLIPIEKREAVGWNFFDVLADLHAIDPDAVGLGDLGKKENYIARQLKTWYRSWTSSHEAADYDDSRAHELQQFLEANIPEQGPARVVHGDYGLHNCLIGPDFKMAAMLDWEISTLGDPLADLAYALNQWILPDDPNPVKPDAASVVPGMPSRESLAARYAARTGCDLSHLDFYIGFNWWKSAMIIHGVYARYMTGKKSTDGIDLNELRSRVERSLDQAAAAVNRIR